MTPADKKQIHKALALIQNYLIPFAGKGSERLYEAELILLHLWQKAPDEPDTRELDTAPDSDGDRPR